MIPPSARISPSNDSLPLLADRRQACSLSARFAWWKFETMPRARISRTHVTPWNGWLYARCAWWSIDHDRPRTCSAGAGELVSPFSVSVSAPRCCGFVTSRSQLRSLLLSERMTVLVSFSRQSHTGVLQLLEPFFYWFSVWRRRRRSAWSWRSTVASAGRSSFFLLPWNCLQFVLKAFSFSRQALLACCCNTPGIHNKLAGNESDRARTAVHQRYEQGGRDFDFGNVSSPRPLIWLPSCFAKQQSGTLLCDRMICFSRKALKNEEMTSSSKQETENKKINEPSWSPFDCVTSRVTQQHSRRYFQLDLTMSCRESMLLLQLQFPATRGTLASVPAICDHERDVKTKAREI